RLGDLFATAKRAPRTVLPELAAISGVAEVDGRVVGDVPVFVVGQPQPATVRFVSLDPSAAAPLDAVRIRRGRLPDPDHDDEVVLNEPFADATHLAPGATVAAVLNGRLRQLRVVGVGISPEFVFLLPAGVISPNDARYGVAWMLRAPLEAAFDLRGACNDFVLRLGPGAVRADIIAAIDRRLARFGGHGAITRADQQSYKMLDVRIERLRGMLVFLPGLFLLVAAFVLNVVLGRLVAGQREQVGVLKAFGYADGRLARHYLELAALTVLPGALVGVAGGLEMGHGLVQLFVHYFRLPLTGEAIDWPAVATALTVVLAAAGLGALQAVRRVVRLQPVEAMRAPSPPVYRHGWIERLHLGERLPVAALMIARNLRLAPWRSLASIAALAFATALCVTGSFFGGSLDALVHHQFDRAMREDLTVAFANPVRAAVCSSLLALDGVAGCEAVATAAVRVHHGSLSRQVAVTALAEPSRLRRIIARDGLPVAVPPTGLLVSRRLLRHLHAEVGDALTLETLEGRPLARAFPVAAALDDELGLNVYVSRQTLRAIVGGEPTASTALLRLGPNADAGLARRLGGLPAVIGVTSRAAAIADFEKAAAAQMRTMTFILALLAAVLAIAVVYNGARVALSERARDLASLRVLGFTEGEVARVLLGEMAIAVGAGVPLGLLLGRWLAGLSIGGVAADEFRLPLVVTP
ncbi:MAG TPA: ABC transporter permease, partial [Polyangia bacterium]|nr:ABC transporter permease [Polyangia bacterium]